ncbi:uncharacterized protein LOC131612339 [Vicia villosa]|uniref:uncharacterized protein LOC131612339 n=1 Tax=Vicia villosa TaxID=3911 RepID=UPI00273C4F6F|nr:uncharacterized protein LOC131612339 [Vicia villosa]
MQKNFLTLLVLLIILSFSSYVLSSSSSPGEKDTPVLPTLAKVIENYGEEVMLVDVEEGILERRMDLETQDYDGTGANRDHEPKPPRV